MVSAGALAADPLRTLRAVRIAVLLELDDRAGDGGGDRRARRPGSTASPPSASSASSSRSSARPAVRAGLALMEAHGITAQVLPELLALRGVEQNVFHHLDVHDHTLEVLDQVVAIERDPVAAGLGEHAERGRGAAAPSRSPTSSPAGRRCASPRCCTTRPSRRRARRAPTAAASASPATTARGRSSPARVLRRLRASEKLVDHVAALCLHHLRLGFLVHERPLDRRDGLALPAGDGAAAAPTSRSSRSPTGSPRAGATPARRSRRTWSSPARCSARRWSAARRGARRRSCAATSWRASSASRRGRGWASCSRSSRRTATRARSARARTRSGGHGSCAG